MCGGEVGFIACGVLGCVLGKRQGHGGAVAGECDFTPGILGREAGTLCGAGRAVLFANGPWVVRPFGLGPESFCPRGGAGSRYCRRLVCPAVPPLGRGPGAGGLGLRPCRARGGLAPLRVPACFSEGWGSWPLAPAARPWGGGIGDSGGCRTGGLTKALCDCRPSQKVWV